jgi:hypothetical protein
VELVTENLEAIKKTPQTGDKIVILGGEIIESEWVELRFLLQIRVLLALVSS